MNRNYTKITRCPICNSKHLTVSEYYGQVWNDREDICDTLIITKVKEEKQK